MQVPCRWRLLAAGGEAAEGVAGDATHAGQQRRRSVCRGCALDLGNVMAAGSCLDASVCLCDGVHVLHICKALMYVGGAVLLRQARYLLLRPVCFTLCGW